MIKLDFKIDFTVFKALFAFSICILASYITGDHNVMFFGGVAAIVCVQHNHAHTLKSGTYRFIGTLIGGFVGMITLMLIALAPSHIFVLTSLIISLFAMVAIYLCNFTGLPDATFVNCVVFLNVVSNYDGSAQLSEAFFYVSERVLYTLLGIAAAYLVNMLAHLYKHDSREPHEKVKIIDTIKGHKLTTKYTIGLRTIKTTIAIFISIVIAYIAGPVESIFFCSVAVARCMQRNLRETLYMGINTFVGTIVGSFVGFLIIDICNSMSEYSRVLEFSLVMLAIFLVMYLCRVFHIQGIIIMTCVILLKMVSNSGGSQTTADMLDFLINPVLLFTVIGIVIAIAVNVFPFIPIKNFFVRTFSRD